MNSHPHEFARICDGYRNQQPKPTPVDRDLDYDDAREEIAHHASNIKMLQDGFMAILKTLDGLVFDGDFVEDEPLLDEVAANIEALKTYLKSIANEHEAITDIKKDSDRF